MSSTCFSLNTMLQERLAVCLNFDHRFVGNLLKGQTIGVIGAGRIGLAYARMMETILVNYSKGPVIDVAALIEHLRENSMFRVGLDDFEDEPYRKPSLTDMKNVVVVPHTASATKGMATLVALNEKIKEYPIWSNPNSVEAFLDENSPPPAACSSIMNSKALAFLGDGTFCQELS
ncbi:Glycerate dehydrogenase HPR, peroxisomal [Capsicum chinense]|nr:Glycerate dehydrogenase HPR, peroxisomal [Capsicum chinense]